MSGITLPASSFAEGLEEPLVLHYVISVDVKMKNEYVGTLEAGQTPVHTVCSSFAFIASFTLEDFFRRDSRVLA